MADAHERHEPHETLFSACTQKIAVNLSEENYKQAAIDQVLLMARSLVHTTFWVYVPCKVHRPDCLWTLSGNETLFAIVCEPFFNGPRRGIEGF